MLLQEEATGVQRRNSSFKLRKCAKAELSWGGNEGFGDRKGIINLRTGGTLLILESVISPSPRLSPGRKSYTSEDPAWTTCSPVRSQAYQDDINVKK